MKAQDFLKRHLDHIAFRKLRRNEQLTPQDLSEFERILVDEIRASDDDLDTARTSGDIGVFVRALVGLERDAAKAAFSGFLSGRNMSANQIESVNLIIDLLTVRGAMHASKFYEDQLTDIDYRGVSGLLLPDDDVQKIIRLLDEVRRKAAV